MYDLDLNLLSAFAAIYQQRSITGAALLMGLSQPADRYVFAHGATLENPPAVARRLPAPAAGPRVRPAWRCGGLARG